MKTLVQYDGLNFTWGNLDLKKEKMCASALSRISPRVRVMVSVSIVLGSDGTIQP